VVAVAVALGLGMPILLKSVAGLGEVHAVMGKLLSTGAVLAVIFISMMSLYISSLSATSLQALLWSVFASVGVFMLAASSTGLAIHSYGFNPVTDLNWTWPQWSSFSTRLTVLLVTLRAIAVALYGGGVWLLLRFGRANHLSAERSTRRLTGQTLWLGMFFALLISLAFVVAKAYVAEATDQSRGYMKRMFGTLTVRAVGVERSPKTTYTVVVFPEDHLWPNGRPRLPYRIESSDRTYGDERPGTALMTPGRYAVVAVETLEDRRPDRSLRDEELIARLKAHATPFTIAAGDSKTLTLTLSSY